MGKDEEKSDRVKIEGDWIDAIKRAFKKKPPKEGWPKGDEAKSDKGKK